MNTEERRIVDRVDVSAMLAFLCDLVAIPSLGGEETPAQERVAVEMERCGLDVDRWDIDFDRARTHPAYTVEIPRNQGLGVVGSLGGTTGRQLILNGHVDVVPVDAEAAWRFPPWRGTVVDDRVYGRGALDMKGGLACALFAAKAVRDAGVGLSGRLIVQSVIGEEDGGVGTLATIQRGYRADGAVIMEPTQLAVAPAQAGALNFRITVPGVAAHGGVRDEGVSAIEMFFPVYRALMDLERQRNGSVPPHPAFRHCAIPYPICVGIVRAGSWASSVPESLIAEGRYGIGVHEDLDTARGELEQCVAAVAHEDPFLSEHPPRVEWWGAQFEPAAIADTHPMVTGLTAAHTDVTGAPPAVRGMPYGADMRLLVNHANTPTVLYGPGDIRLAHRRDEHVPIADLVTVAHTLAVMAYRWCA